MLYAEKKVSFQLLRRHKLRTRRILELYASFERARACEIWAANSSCCFQSKAFCDVVTELVNSRGENRALGQSKHFQFP